MHELPAGVAVSGRDLARRAGLSHPTASKALAAFVEQGIVRVRRAPRAAYYELNPSSAFFEPAQRLFAWEAALRQDVVTFLGRELARHRVRASDAVLFGSASRRDMTSGSDIDLAVVVPGSSMDEVEASMELIGEAVRERFGARLSPLVGTEPLERLRRPSSQAHRLWDRIAGEGIPIDLEAAEGGAA